MSANLGRVTHLYKMSSFNLNSYLNSILYGLIDPFIIALQEHLIHNDET